MFENSAHHETAPLRTNGLDVGCGDPPDGSTVTATTEPAPTGLETFTIEVPGRPEKRPAGAALPARVPQASEVLLELPLVALVERVERVRRDEGVRVFRHQKKYGARSSAPSAYQAPKARLNAASAGASRLKEARIGAEASARPKPVESSAIDSAVQMAKMASAARASRWPWIDASSRMPTPALPPVPWTRPIP